MARLPRLEIPGQVHYIIHRGHGALAGRGVFVDNVDRLCYLAALREAAAAQGVLVHAWALLGSEVHLLATPATSGALGRMVQAIGRRYVSAYNRRHGHHGTLWDGRFRCAVIEPGAMRLAAVRLVDSQSSDPEVTSAGCRTGLRIDPLLSNPPEIWALGNTPFEREAAYRSLLADPVPAAVAHALRQAALGGWAAGSADFAAEVLRTTARPARPRARGRPSRPR